MRFCRLILTSSHLHFASLLPFASLARQVSAQQVALVRPSQQHRLAEVFLDNKTRLKPLPLAASALPPTTHPPPAPSAHAQLVRLALVASALLLPLRAVALSLLAPHPHNNNHSNQQLAALALPLSARQLRQRAVSLVSSNSSSSSPPQVALVPLLVPSVSLLLAQLPVKSHRVLLLYLTTLCAKI